MYLFYSETIVYTIGQEGLLATGTISLSVLQMSQIMQPISCIFDEIILKKCLLYCTGHKDTHSFLCFLLLWLSTSLLGQDGHSEEKEHQGSLPLLKSMGSLMYHFNL